MSIQAAPFQPNLPGGPVQRRHAHHGVQVVRRQHIALVRNNGAHRASKLFSGIRALILAAVFLGLSGLVAAPSVSAATPMKVVIVVGPTGTGTAHNIADAQQLAAQARATARP